MSDDHDDVMSGVAAYMAGMDVHVKFGDFTLNGGRIVGLVAIGPVLPTYMQFFCSIQLQFADELNKLATSHPADIWLDMRLTVPEKCVQFRDPPLNRSGEI